MPYLHDRRWMIVRSPAPFLTTDRPVIILEGARNTLRGVGLGNAKSIAFVLDRHRAVLMDNDLTTAEGVVDVSADFARRLNTIAANGSRRWIFHHPDDKPLEGVSYNANTPDRLPHS